MKVGGRFLAGPGIEQTRWLTSPQNNDDRTGTKQKQPTVSMPKNIFIRLAWEGFSGCWLTHFFTEGSLNLPTIEQYNVYYIMEYMTV